MRTVAWLAATLAVSAVPSHGMAQTAQDDVRTAVAGIYAGINSGDPDAVTQYIATGGYTELTSEGRLVTLDAAYMRRVLGPAFKANFRVTELQLRIFTDVALVTGYRVGGVLQPGGAPSEARFALSMLWVREPGGWKLSHVHLSPATGEKPREPAVDPEQAIRNTHTAWFDALLGEDANALDNLVADDVTLAFPGGNLMPRADFLSYLKRGELFYDTADHEDALVRVYGTVGVVTGRSNLGYRFTGNAGLERLTYTAVYARREERWQLVAWHSTLRRQ